MPPFISSLEDRSSSFYRGRAQRGNLPDTDSMVDSSWRARLKQAVEGSDKSKRAISMASGNGPGYVHSILNEGKEPTIENLMSVCEAIPASPVYVIFGVRIKSDDLEILKALEGNPESRAGILSILRAKAG